MPDIKNGIIELDSDFGKELGFTSDKFDGYLWRDNNFITISFIISKQPNKGNFIRLLKRIEELGYRIKVPTPFAGMQFILEKYGGFKITHEIFKEAGGAICEVWVK